MIVVEPVPVHRTAVLTRGNFRHDDDAIIPAFRRLTDACREANPDIVMIHQLYHVGQHGDADNSFAPNWSPSGLPSYHDADGSHAMTAAEIEELIEGFVAAAGRAQASGFDGIEVFAAYNALVDQFWTPWSNRRTDEWGGVVREPDALLVRDPAPDPGALRRGLHRRPRDQRRPGVGGVPVDRRARRDRRVARRAAADGLRHLRDRLVLRFRGDHPDVAVRRAARRAVRRGAQGGRPPRAGPGREPHPDARRGRGRPGRRSRRHGQHRPRPDRRPAPGRQGPRRPRGRGAAVHLVQPAVLGPALARLLDLVPRQPVGGARMGVGRRPVRGEPAIRGGSWSSAAGRPGWRRRASPPSAAIA